jgi:hypothetical protein
MNTYANKENAIKAANRQHIEAFYLEETENHRWVINNLVNDAKSQFSRIARPCLKVWEIAGRMRGCSRRAVIKACIKAGIAKGTANTQYYKWKKATYLK